MLSMPLGFEGPSLGGNLTRRQLLHVGGLSMLGLGLPGALRASDPARVREQQLADLRSIQREFSDRFKVPIEAYYARLERGEATFERIDG